MNKPSAKHQSGGVILLTVLTIALAQSAAATGTIMTAAGNGTPGFSGDSGPAPAAMLNTPSNVAAADNVGNFYIADTANNRVRVVSFGVITTVAGNGTAGFSGDGGPATNAQLNHPTGVALDGAQNIYIADRDNHRIRRVGPGGNISTFAGTGVPGYSGDGGPAAAAQLNHPTDVALDNANNVLVADTDNNVIRRIDSVAATISTMAGNGTPGFSGDGGPAVAAQLNHPTGLDVRSNIDLLIADRDNNRIRRVDLASFAITTAAGTGVAGFSGDGGLATAARLDHPFDVAAAFGDRFFIADMDNSRVRRVDSFVIRTVVGTGTAGFNGDGDVNCKQVNHPTGLAFESNSNELLLADSDNHRIRRLSPDAQAQECGADLSIGKTASPNPVAVGSTITYTLQVTNHGPNDANSVEVTDNLPGSTVFVSCVADQGGICGGSGNNRTVTFSSLANQAVATITLTATVDCDVADGSTISNTASVTAATSDSEPSNNSATADVTATNAAPEVGSVSASPSTLWPANHKMVGVTISYNGNDECGGSDCALSVASNEPINGAGDGNSSPDWQVIDAHHVLLRAERAGKGNGRVYTITVTCSDGSGGSSSQTVNVSVPKNQAATKNNAQKKRR